MENNFSLIDIFRMGGIFMWPLLFFSIWALAIVIERAVYFLYHNLHIEDIEARVQGYLVTGNMRGAQDYLSALIRKQLGARVLLVMVKQRDIPESQLEKAVEASAASCIREMEIGFNFLTALGSLSPLTGFLGTVSGMIGAFKSIAEAENVNAQIVASGIYEALITTVFGLIIAITAMLAHAFLSHLVDSFASDIEKTCSDLMVDITRLNAMGRGRTDLKLLPSPRPNQVLSLEEYT
ncbi:MAG: MotA/TolQ/ExbB proton channel family protein [Treponema sp.]|jgi:biopolymer transport protein ExbB|nr:MotA/TolQ/ExbB proton channel family protein [Treponema sp.]